MVPHHQTTFSSSSSSQNNLNIQINSSPFSRWGNELPNKKENVLLGGKELGDDATIKYKRVLDDGFLNFDRIDQAAKDRMMHSHPEGIKIHISISIASGNLEEAWRLFWCLATTKYQLSSFKVAVSGDKQAGKEITIYAEYEKHQAPRFNNFLKEINELFLERGIHPNTTAKLTTNSSSSSISETLTDRQISPYISYRYDLYHDDEHPWPTHHAFAFHVKRVGYINKDHINFLYALLQTPNIHNQNEAEVLEKIKELTEVFCKEVTDYIREREFQKKFENAQKELSDFNNNMRPLMAIANHITAEDLKNESKLQSLRLTLNTARSLLNTLPIHATENPLEISQCLKKIKEINSKFKLHLKLLEEDFIRLDYQGSSFTDRFLTEIKLLYDKVKNHHEFKFYNLMGDEDIFGLEDLAVFFKKLLSSSSASSSDASALLQQASHAASPVPGASSNLSASIPNNAFLGTAQNINVSSSTSSLNSDLEETLDFHIHGGPSENMQNQQVASSSSSSGSNMLVSLQKPAIFSAPQSNLPFEKVQEKQVASPPPANSVSSSSFNPEQQTEPAEDPNKKNKGGCCRTS